MSKYIAPGQIVTQERDLYRVDGWLVAPEAIPPTTLVPFELEMVCFKQPAWHDLKGPFICTSSSTSSSTFSSCVDYWNAGYAGDTDYENADVHAQSDVPVASTLDYEKADVELHGSGSPGECL